MVATSCVVLLPISTLVVVRRVRLFRGHRVEYSPALPKTDIGPSLWMEPDFRVFLQKIGPSVAASVFGEGGIAAFAGGYPVSAGVLLALAVAVPASRWPTSNHLKRSQGWGVEVALVFVLALALASGLAHPGAGGPEATVRRPLPFTGSAVSHHGADLSGIILTLPPRPRQTELPPPPSKHGQAITAARPLRIEFDGVYWYFQAPDRWPQPDAKVVQGDPVRANIRSTNALSLRMEAHQRLPEHTSLDQYHEIVVRMRDADNLPGLLRVSLLLEGEKGTEPLLLGTRVLEASRMRVGYEYRPAVEEELRFAVTTAASGKDWVGVVVRVEPEWARAQAAAHVAVVNFLLQP